LLLWIHRSIERILTTTSTTNDDPPATMRTELEREAGERGWKQDRASCGGDDDDDIDPPAMMRTEVVEAGERDTQAD